MKIYLDFKDFSLHFFLEKNLVRVPRKTEDEIFYRRKIKALLTPKQKEGIEERNYFWSISYKTFDVKDAIRELVANLIFAAKEDEMAKYQKHLTIDKIVQKIFSESKELRNF